MLLISLTPILSTLLARLQIFSESHCGALVCCEAYPCFAYLKGTFDFGICFSRSSSTGILSTFSDGDYAGCLKTRRTTTGYVLILNGGPVSWTFRRQQGVATSTTESEYTAAFEATKETVWVRNLLHHISMEQQLPTTLFCDNQSAIKMVQNPEFHSRTKHIDVHIHFVREKQDDKTISIQYISTHDQLADILTKPLHRVAFEKLHNAISVSRRIDSTHPIDRPVLIGSFTEEI
jgi:hypothetical protein